MTSERRYFVFRTDDSEKEFIWNELNEGRLRQGWGVAGTQLRERDGTVVEKNVWIERYKQAALSIWDDTVTDQQAENRYWILRPLLEAKEGDIVLIPKMPTWGNFTIAQIAGGYFFDFDLQPPDADHRHVLPVDPNSLRVFPHTATEETLIIASKLRAYQKAVNNVNDQRMKEAIGKLLEPSDRSLEPREPDQIFRESIEELLEKTLKRVRDYPPDAFEKLVKKVFEGSGYELLEAHRYDGSGGDADLVFRLNLPIISQVANKDLLVYVQVKKKEGTDPQDVVHIDQLVKIAKEPDALKILVSSADKFSDECVRKAEETGVTLIGGLDVARLLLLSNLSV